VVGVDLSETAVGLAKANLATSGQAGTVLVADGGDLPLPAASVDVFYAHGVLQYAAEPGASSKKGCASSGRVGRRSSWSTTACPG
jgi:hypothetical protein